MFKTEANQRRFATDCRHLLTIHIISEDAHRCQSVAILLMPAFETTAIPLDALDGRRGDFESVVISVDLRSTKNIEKLRRIESKIRNAKKRIVILDSVSHLLAAQAYSLGATKVLFQPSVRDILRALMDDPGLPLDTVGHTSKVASAGALAIKRLFASVVDDTKIDLAAIEKTGKMISDVVAEEGLTNWLNVVRNHHEGTYQHCLLVTGVTVDFGLHLGMHKLDIGRLSSAAMAHDIGKAAIPTSILDKPGKLDEAERATIETHPSIGFDALRQLDGVSPEILDGVLHHHELLDGSGYPHGLCDGSISDLVRILTISDIFTALIERRSYKPSMNRDTAYEILCSMRGKIEAPLVSAFKEVALRR